jgi:HEAT repeat protein
MSQLSSGAERKDIGTLLCVLVAYMCAASASLIARSAGDALFLARFDHRDLSFMYIGTACVVGPFSYFFGVQARAKTLTRIQILGCGAVSVAAALLRIALGIPAALIPGGFIRILTYFWADIAVAASMLVFWTFFGQVFDVRRAKSMVGRVGAAGTTACIGAGYAIHPFVAMWGTADLLLVVAGLTAVLAGAIAIASRRRAVTPKPDSAIGSAPARLPNFSYYLDLLKSGRARNLAIQVALGTAAITIVDYRFKVGAQANYQGPALAAFFGSFYATSNLVVLAIQLFAVRWLLKGRTLALSLCILPAGLLMGSVATLMGAGFTALLATRFISQTTIFTIDTSGLQILYLGIKKQSQNQVRALVEGIAKPFSVCITGILLAVLSTAVNTAIFAALTIALCAGWMLLARRNYAFYVQGLLSGLESQTLDLSGETGVLRTAAVAEYIRLKMRSAAASEVRYLLRLIDEFDGRGWLEDFRAVLDRPEADLKVAALDYLASRGGPPDVGAAMAQLSHPEAEVRCAAVRATARLSLETTGAALTEALKDGDPRVRAEAAAALLGSEDLTEMIEAVDAIRVLLRSTEPLARRAIADPVSRMAFRGRGKILLQLLGDADVEVRISALKACAGQRDPQLARAVLAQSLHPQTAEAAADTLAAWGDLTVRHLNEYSLPALADALGRSPALLDALVRIGGGDALQLLCRALDAYSEDRHREDASPLLRAWCELFRKQDGLRTGSLPNQETLFVRKWQAALRWRRECGREIPMRHTEFLARALREEAEGHTEDLFRLLDARFPEAGMLRILAALNSGTRERRAQALEILENVLPGGPREKTMQLVEPEDMDPRDSHSAIEFLCRLISGGEPEPVVLGALYAAACNRIIDAASSIERLAQGPGCEGLSPAIRETAQYALRIIHGETESKNKMTIVEIVAFLQDIPLFASMKTGELIQLASVTKQTTCPAGSYIMVQGEPGDHMFVVVDGRVGVQRDRVELNRLGPKDFLGEMSLIDGEPRSASAIAITDCLLLRLDRSDFTQLLATRNSIALGIINSLTQRLRQTMAVYEELRQSRVASA